MNKSTKKLFFHTYFLTFCHLFRQIEFQRSISLKTFHFFCFKDQDTQKRVNIFFPKTLIFNSLFCIFLKKSLFFHSCLLLFIKDTWLIEKLKKSKTLIFNFYISIKNLYFHSSPKQTSLTCYLHFYKSLANYYSLKIS